MIIFTFYTHCSTRRLENDAETLRTFYKSTCSMWVGVIRRGSQGCYTKVGGINPPRGVENSLILHTRQKWNEFAQTDVLVQSEREKEKDGAQRITRTETRDSAGTFVYVLSYLNYTLQKPPNNQIQAIAFIHNFNLAFSDEVWALR